jgi:uncharacterized YigZ family protein
LKAKWIYMHVYHYLTIQLPVIGEYKEKGSKFIAYAYPITNSEESKFKIEILKKEHHAARHHCWAYRILPDGSKYRVHDDGEPSNSAGKPILGQIEAYNLTNILVVVVRYFGGTLLGVGGLIHAYKEATKNALQQAHIITKYVEKHITIECDFQMVNTVIVTCKQYDGTILSQKFDMPCIIECSIPLQNEELFIQTIRKQNIIIT